MTALTVPGLPFALEAEGPASSFAPTLLADGVALRCAARTDLFRSPAGNVTPPDAERYVAAVAGDFLLSAHVDVDFASLFDAGVLLGYVDGDNWFKLCAEFDPTGTPRVVSVVTRDGVSDDANSWPLGASGLFLRIARLGSAFALHTSPDGARWQLVRHFALSAAAEGGFSVGLMAQSPTGDGCRTRFTEVRFAAETLADIRDGS